MKDTDMLIFSGHGSTSSYEQAYSTGHSTPVKYADDGECYVMNTMSYNETIVYY